MSRALTILCALTFLLFAQPARAGLRFHGSAPAPNPPNMTFTLRGTETQAVDLTAVLASASATELISATYTGPVKLAVWQYPDPGAGVTRTYRKRELLDFLTAKTSGAADATLASTWTLAGSFGTWIGGFNVASPEITTWNYGANTDIRSGGYPTYLLAGGATDWTTADANWEVYNGRLVIKCVGSLTLCPASGGGAYYTGAAAPKILVGARTGADVPVVIHSNSLGVNKTITMHWVANQWDVAPTPAWMANNAGTSELCNAIEQQLKFGDVVMMEGSAEHPQVYGGTGSSWRCFGGATATHATQRAGGPAAPTEAAGWGDGTNDAGWIQARGREYWAANIIGFQLDHRNLSTGSNGGPAYVRWSGIDNQTGYVDAIFSANNGVGGKTTSWVQEDHTLSAALNWASLAGLGASAHDIFLTDNWINGSTVVQNGIVLYACDSQILGNRIEQPNTDYKHLAIWQCTLGGTRARIAWEFEYGGFSATTINHLDHAQQLYSTVTSIPSPGYSDGPLEYANTYVQGPPHLVDCHDVYVTGIVGAYSGAGCSGTQVTAARSIPADINVKVLAGAQGVFRGDVGGLGDTYLSSTVCGNLIVEAYQFAIGFAFSGPAGKTCYNTTADPSTFTSQAFVAAGLGAPFLQYLGVGAQVLTEGNIISGPINPGTYAGIAAPTPALGLGNFASTSGSEATYFADPTNSGNRDLTLIQSWLDMYAPTNSAKISGAFVGAVNNGKFDIRGRVINDATVLVNNTVGQAPPKCNVSPTITGTTTLTVSAQATFTNSPGSFEDQWVYADSTARGSGTTYVTVGGDSGKTMFYIRVGVNADGKGACISNAITVP